MKTSKYLAEQVAFALRQAESGTPVPEVCRKIGISEQTFYRWKKKHVGMGVAEVRRLRVLEVCYQVSERRVCGVIQLQRSTCRYRSIADEQAALRIRLRDLEPRQG